MNANAKNSNLRIEFLYLLLYDFEKIITIVPVLLLLLKKNITIIENNYYEKILSKVEFFIYLIAGMSIVNY